MSELFSLPETLSPMEEWRQRHDVHLYETQSGWKATTDLRKAHGETQESALLAWADKAGVKCWKSEELERLNAGKSSTHTPS